MSEIKIVWVQVAAPSARNPEGVVEAGYYKILEDGSVQMCAESGKPIGHKVKRETGESAQRIAGRLTKERWAKKARENSNNFNRQIVYPPWRPA
jgi:hypothetical protein